MMAAGLMNQEERARRASIARKASSDLATRNISTVAVTWVDTSGVTRVKAVPTARLEHAAAWGIGMSPVFDVFLFNDSYVSGRYVGGPVGDLRLHPDLERLTGFSALPGWAWAPADRYDQNGTMHPQDSRGLARRAVDQLAADGYTVRASFEIEWAASVGEGDDFVPACVGPAYGMTRITERAGYLRDVVEALTASGIVVEQIHPEYAPGQYEISVAAADPVTAADNSVLVRETIRAVSQSHGLRASFSPKVVAGGVGNGMHVHISLWREGHNVMAGGGGMFGLTPAGEGFAGGMLAHLPGLLAIGAPSVASYLRLVPYHWAGAFACWGLENREAALRFVTGAAGSQSQAANFEVKSFDPTANPYLTMAALLAAGHSGLTEGAVLPKPVDVDPATLGPEHGIQRLPSSLTEALQALEADAVLGKVLGDEVIDTIAAVRRGEMAVFEGASPEEIAAKVRWTH